MIFCYSMTLVNDICRNTELVTHIFDTVFLPSITENGNRHAQN